MQILPYKKLTICIPTYNRIQYLCASLDILINQVNERESEVNIFISDNASTDNTETIIKERYANQSDCLFYYKMLQNNGAEHNFEFCVSQSNSEYIYLLGDDDLVSPFFVETVLKLIDKNKDVCFFHFNYLVVNHRTSKTTVVSDIEGDLLLHYFDNGVSFLSSYFDKPSFMSSDMFRKSCWNNSEDTRAFDGYGWYYKILSGIMDKPCLATSIPLVVARTAGSSYSSTFLYLYVVCMSKVFLALDKSLFNKWINYSQMVQKWTFKSFLLSSSNNKRFYRKHAAEIRSMIMSRKNRLLFSCSIYLFPKIVANYFLKPLFYFGRLLHDIINANEGQNCQVERSSVSTKEFGKQKFNFKGN
jgi:glycosyltransferase involved in cell wall biosynthesis